MILINTCLLKKNVTERKAAQKQEGSKGKTFPVPFTLEPIKDNISITTTTPASPSKPSKEQIIKQAFEFHSQGNISEASKNYQYFIQQGFKDYRVFSNYGVILNDAGNLQEAELSYRKAIELKPDFAEAYSNLGNVLRDLGNLEDAELSQRKAIELKTDFAEAHYNLGNVLRDLGNLQDAELSQRKAIEIKPDYAEAHSNLGNVLRDLGNLQDAELSQRKAIEIKPDYAEAYSNLGNVLRDLGNLQGAEQFTRKAIEIKPDFANAYLNLGSISKDLGNLKDAELSYRKAIEIKTDFAEAHSNLGNVLRDLGNLKDAEQFTRKAIEIKPDYAEAHSNLGNVLRDLGNLKDAEQFTRKAIEIKPDFANAYLNLGSISKDLGNLQDAELSYRKAIEIKTDFAEAHYNLGNVLRDLGYLKDAELSYRKAIEIKPDFANAYLNLGSILKDLGYLQDAEQLTRKAIEIKPDFAEAYSNLGNVLRDLGKSNEAVKLQREAIQLKPDFAEAFSNLGSVLLDLGKLNEAELSTLKAIQLKPDFAEAYYNLGLILKDLSNFDNAITHFKEALKLNNKLSMAKASLIETKGIICDWSDQDIQTNWIKNLGIEGSSVSPYALLYFEDNPLNHLERSKKFFKEKYPRPTKHIKSSQKNIIHIGYFSADFRTHPVMQLIAPILELHDKSRFKIYLYSFVPKEDEYTERARKSGCIFRDISKLNNIEAVSLAREDQIDIAIDLMGYTKHNRFSIFSSRVAPIQINYLGHPASLGSDVVDYLIADKIIIPDDDEKFYSEKILRMPNCWLCNDDKIKKEDESISRKDFKLPEKGFIFTCFNNNIKITKKEFDIWMRLLKGIKGSVLWLKKPNKFAIDNLYREAEKRSVDPKRLIFATKVPFDLHLARLSLGDLGLDTFNFNGHKTTSDALCAGLPTLTKSGEHFAARVSSSLLTSIGLPELITYDENHYEETALRLASNHNELFKLKSKLQRLKNKSSLFNAKLYTKDLENIYLNLLQK
nr:tetratricopeptide repeat protein [Prochlorococcus marinus]